jgi:antitoxin component YwqK of YwqJK toxin-antitoxin module
MLIAKFSEFYETGALKIIGKYENGLEEGIWKIYDVNGNIKERGRYKKGKKVGIWKTFH